VDLVVQKRQRKRQRNQQKKLRKKEKSRFSLILKLYFKKAPSVIHDGAFFVFKDVH
jgi:hypothetical protein